MADRVLLKTENLVVKYGEVTALKGIDIEIRENLPTAVIGPNGAGKTTLLQTISGIIKPAGGDIFFRESRITDLAPHEIVKCGISQVPEGRRIFPYMTVYENLKMGSYLERDRRKFRANLDKVYALFPELKKRKSQLGGTLSGGEQQMLSIGRALMRDITILLLDEPTIGLSPIMVNVLSDRIRELTRSGINILLVEQNVKMALALSEQCYLMNIGKIELSERSDLLVHDERILKTYLGSS